MQRRMILSLAGAGFLAACTPAIAPGAMRLAPNSTLVVVRHADRNGEDLSTTGSARARSLVEVLSNTDLAAIHAPDIKRNLDTAAPLAQARGLPVVTPRGASLTRQLVRRARGRGVIWIGNKSNIREIWRDLALPDPAPLDYGSLAIIRSDANGAVTVERRNVPAD
ncbi:histidine phosphatase family protein [Lutimaribacter sp. EGI FJ00015]|uniref:Histidine phosphatase family protein n=1 Tax=Lutimaribacter degradans TaxID=2945989 RepID=A0ACC5ZRU0_9RHOB|nr:histidine phosphatase family protein [Lutimaribacter sp. EGI FJ00013]MCM2560570.1 histidine phosphatase family protein [Lutimaribacter sp. EGI FJ00013]MCO0612487.1 histidine phosphatase family protein [Lutimaribacter sp. EGI FJ00015]MCO0634394.1 histidine phosphatase family protein [Lutimaribacter sp. EGI FJ00014]